MAQLFVLKGLAFRASKVSAVVKMPQGNEENRYVPYSFPGEEASKAPVKSQDNLLSNNAN